LKLKQNPKISDFFEQQKSIIFVYDNIDSYSLNAPLDVEEKSLAHLLYNIQDF
jgi:hypothetical protein